jgi:hypothetical protein
VILRMIISKLMPDIGHKRCNRGHYLSVSCKKSNNPDRITASLSRLEGVSRMFSARKYSLFFPSELYSYHLFVSDVIKELVKIDTRSLKNLAMFIIARKTMGDLHATSELGNVALWSASFGFAAERDVTGSKKI